MPLDHTPADARPTHPPAHLAHLDGLRAALALYVVGQHCYSTVTGDVPTAGLAAFGWLNYGRLAVDAFIVISGYCLMLPVVRRGGVMSTPAATFYWRRFRRIVPTFYAAVVLCGVAGRWPLAARSGTIWDTCLPVTPGAVLANLAMAGDLLRASKVNYVFWSVAVEWRIYFAFPLLVWAFARLGPRRTTALAVAVAIALAFAVRSHEVVRNTVCYAGLFTLGMWAATGTGRRPAAALAAVAAGLAVGIVALAAWVGDGVLKNPAYDLAVAACTAAALANWGRAESSAGRRLLAARPLASVGTFSYSLYLTHAPVVQAVWEVAVRPLHVTPAVGLIALYALTVPAAIAVAFVFFLAFERPFMSARQRRAVAEEVPLATAPVAVDRVAPTV